MPKKKEEGDSYEFKGWLTSESFVKRSLAVTGYAIAGAVILSLIGGLIKLILLVISGA